eukprot:3039361-Rhodomonas_salina.1
MSVTALVSQAERSPLNEVAWFIMSLRMMPSWLGRDATLETATCIEAAVRESSKTRERGTASSQRR